MQKLNHLAFIMDGNGRWASARRKPRLFGHVKGSLQLNAIIREVSKLGIPYLSLYAFSIENWQRPQEEVKHLMKILIKFLKKERALMVKQGIRLNAIGNLSHLPTEARQELMKTMEMTSQGERMTLTLALSYGSRQEITQAVKRIALDYKDGKLAFDDINEVLVQSYMYTYNLPDPDLIIRTSGEMRLSNFLLWQSAYTELYISNKNWPDFNVDDLHLALNDYAKRERRFGKINSYESVRNEIRLEQH